MSAAEVADADDNPVKKRRRGPYACSLCRQRKVRCDGKDPCTNCAASDVECIYGSDPVTKGKSDTLIDKSDAILEGVLRLDGRLSYLANVLGASGSNITAAYSPQTASSTEPSLIRNTRALARDHRQDDTRLDNAVMSARHTSTTESVLAWSYFDSFPGLRHNYQPIFTLEQHRPGVADYEINEMPVMKPDEAVAIIGAFQTTINFAYPTVAIDRLEDVERRVLERKLDNSIESCHALLIMALGCASQAVSILQSETPVSKHHHQRSRDLALVYFGLVLKRLHFIQLEISTTATQCIFFTAEVSL